MQLSHDVKIQQVVTPTLGAANTTDLSVNNGGTLVVDMQGYRQVEFIVQMGAIAATAVTSIKAQQGDAADLSDASDLLGTAQAIAADADDKVFFINLDRLTKRYVGLFVDRGTDTAALTAIALLQGSRRTPVTHGANVSGETFVDPIAGTA